MSDYFDYIHESSQEDIDDVNIIYNEYEMAINEFDSYVQEGIGLKILVGIGLAALIGLLIGVIVKLVSGGSGSSVTSSISQAQKKIELAKKYGVEKVKFGFLLGEGWLSENDMKLFDIMKSECELGLEQFKDLINIFEKFVETGEVEPTTELYNDIQDSLAKFAKRTEKVVGTLNTIPGMSIEKYNNLKPGDIGMKDLGWNKQYGEEGEIDIVEVDKRLKELKEYQKSFKSVGSQLQKLKKQAEDFEKKNPQLMDAIQPIIYSLKEPISDQLNTATTAGAAMKKSADSVSKAIDKTITHNKLIDSLM